jgi:hypothetical protein
MISSIDLGTAGAKSFKGASWCCRTHKDRQHTSNYEHISDKAQPTVLAQPGPAVALRGYKATRLPYEA